MCAGEVKSHSPIFQGDVIRGTAGTHALCVTPGTVVFSGWYGGYGKVVIVRTVYNYASIYPHLEKALVPAGQRVQRKQLIGIFGNTGFLPKSSQPKQDESQLDGKVTSEPSL